MEKTADGTWIRVSQLLKPGCSEKEIQTHLNPSHHGLYSYARKFRVSCILLAGKMSYYVKKYIRLRPSESVHAVQLLLTHSLFINTII